MPQTRNIPNYHKSGPYVPTRSKEAFKLYRRESYSKDSFANYPKEEVDPVIGRKWHRLSEDEKKAYVKKVEMKEEEHRRMTEEMKRTKMIEREIMKCINDTSMRATSSMVPKYNSNQKYFPYGMSQPPTYTNKYNSNSLPYGMRQPPNWKGLYTPPSNPTPSAEQDGEYHEASHESSSDSDEDFFDDYEHTEKIIERNIWEMEACNPHSHPKMRY